jgi:hypothetical protein
MTGLPFFWHTMNLKLILRGEQTMQASHSNFGGKDKREGSL